MSWNENKKQMFLLSLYGTCDFTDWSNVSQLSTQPSLPDFIFSLLQLKPDKLLMIFMSNLSPQINNNNDQKTN